MRTIDADMPSRVIRFYFDYVSPNAYLAWTQLPALAERCGAVVQPVPVLFAGLLEAHRQLGPTEVPAKMRWMWTNVLRKAATIGVALNAPAFHPFKSASCASRFVACTRSERTTRVDRRAF